MRKADRLFQVVNLIRVHQPIAAAELARRLNVSVRTIYRYVDDLSVSGIPIYGTAGIGYALHDDFELPPLSLNQDEVEALMLGVEMLAVSTGSELAAAARSLLSKVEAALPARERRPTQTAIHALNFGQANPALRYWDTLRRIIRECQAVEIRYLSLDDEVSERVIFPLGLFYWGGKWTVAAWCSLRGAYRNFRVDLIQALRVLPELAWPSQDISLRAYMQQQAEACEELRERGLSREPAPPAKAAPATAATAPARSGARTRASLGR